MMRPLSAVLLVSAFACAPAAGADPEILMPGCTGGQVPQAGACAAESSEIDLGDAPGANPNVGVGLTPGQLPNVLPLGVTPWNLPVVLPLGVTPPNLQSR